jgi:uncharacterized C2H2 Zn-finger protein
MVKCGLCAYPVESVIMVDQKSYHLCPRCGAVFLDAQCYLEPAEEKKRYEQHRNDVNDPRYQQFVRPVVDNVQDLFGPGHRGLDFGAGPGPVIYKLLKDQGYAVRLYDPFFWNDQSALEEDYDYIVCCEVIEHFFSPAREFRLLRSLLNEGGALFCKTEVLTDHVDFSRWYYKNDPTHVFFYRPRTLTWIQKHFGFSSLKIDDRLIIFFT